MFRIVTLGKNLLEMVTRRLDVTLINMTLSVMIDLIIKVTIKNWLQVLILIGLNLIGRRDFNEI